MLRKCRKCEFDRHIESLVTTNRDVTRECVTRVFGVHRICRIKTECGAPWAAKRTQDLVHDLVGAISHPHAVNVDGDTRFAQQIRSEISPKCDCFAIGIAIESGRCCRHCCRYVAHELGAGPERIFVGVESYGHIDLWRTIGRDTDQVGAYGHRARGHHVAASKRTRIASPCPGRSSACASVTT